MAKHCIESTITSKHQKASSSTTTRNLVPVSLLQYRFWEVQSFCEAYNHTQTRSNDGDLVCAPRRLVCLNHVAAAAVFSNNHCFCGHSHTWKILHDCLAWRAQRAPCTVHAVPCLQVQGLVKWQSRYATHFSFTFRFKAIHNSASTTTSAPGLYCGDLLGAVCVALSWCAQPACPLSI
jgi:hypothetical protein